jgi:hypothetical protein
MTTERHGRRRRCYRCGALGFWAAFVYPGNRPVCTRCLRRSVLDQEQP